jgi:tetratricopeptide (TPR) repeat protein
MTQPQSLWQMYTDSGKAYFQMRQYKESENMLGSALQVAEQFGPGDQRLTLSLNNLARLRQAQKRFAEAEELYNRALAIVESEHGRQHPDSAVCLSNLAGLLQFEQKYPEAEAAYTEAIAILESTLGPDHESIGRVLGNYVALLRKMGRAADAAAADARAKSFRGKPRA